MSAKVSQNLYLYYIVRDHKLNSYPKKQTIITSKTVFTSRQALEKLRVISGTSYRLSVNRLWLGLGLARQI